MTTANQSGAAGETPTPRKLQTLNRKLIGLFVSDPATASSISGYIEGLERERADLRRELEGAKLEIQKHLKLERDFYDDLENALDEHRHQSHAIVTDIRTLISALALAQSEGKRDGERLDWLDKNHWMDGGEFIDGDKWTEIRVLTPGKAGDFPGGIRDAIDAAMPPPPPTQEGTNSK